MDSRAQRIEGIDWLASMRQVRWAAMMVFAALGLALVSAAAWMQTRHEVLLLLAQIAAAGAALLRLREAVLETRLVFLAWQYVRSRWRHVRHGDISRLRGYLRVAVKLMLLAWLVVFSLAWFPVVMHLPARIPGSEGIYVIATFFLVVHFAASQAAYRRLAAALIESLELQRIGAIPA